MSLVSGSNSAFNSSIFFFSSSSSMSRPSLVVDFSFLPSNSLRLICSSPDFDVIPHQLGDLGAVGGVFMDTQF